MKIIVVNVNTSTSMTDAIAEAAGRHASPGTTVVTLRPYFGAEAVDCNFESYLSAVAVMDRVLAYDEPYDAVILAGFGEHGRDGLQELIDQPVVEICEASAHVAMMIGRAYSVVTTLRRSVPAIEDRLRLAGLWDRCASVRACGMSTLEVDADPEDAVRAIVAEARCGSAGYRRDRRRRAAGRGSRRPWTEDQQDLNVCAARRQEDHRLAAVAGARRAAPPQPW